jgi:hypothetical protein
MPVSRIQSKLHASIFYVGSAVFLGSGVVALADHPLNSGPPIMSCLCNQGLGNACTQNNGGCTGHPHLNCNACDCDISPKIGPYCTPGPPSVLKVCETIGL